MGGGASITRHLVATIRANEGDVLVKANVKEILIDRSTNQVKGAFVLASILDALINTSGVRVSNGKKTVDISAPVVISGAGVPVTFAKLLPKDIAEKSRK